MCHISYLIITTIKRYIFEIKIEKKKKNVNQNECFFQKMKSRHIVIYIELRQKKNISQNYQCQKINLIILILFVRYENKR